MTSIRKATLLFFLTALLCLGACRKTSDSTQTNDSYTGVPLVILDADFGSSTDDLFAAEFLYYYQDKGMSRLIGVIADRMGEQNAAIVDIMNTYYGYGNIPIGLERNGIQNSDVYIDYTSLAEIKDSIGKPMFERTVNDYSKLPDGWKLYRKLLSESPDHSVSIVITGFITAVAQLLESEGDEYSSLTGQELVKKKVKAAYIMGGKFDEENPRPGYNFRFDPDAARTFYKLWPTEIKMHFSPSSIGNNLFYPTDSVLKDISWTNRHPIKQIFMNFDCGIGQKMWDVLPVIQAVEGDQRFKLSKWGNVTFTENNLMPFTESENGFCRYQIKGDDKWNEEMLQYIRDVNRKHWEN